MDAFRTKKETIKATYTAAEAQTRINEAFTGISEEMGDVGLAIQRAEDKTAQMRARAGALDELMASGALEDMVSGPHDDIQAELDRMGAGQGVDRELEQMKRELAQSEPRQIEMGDVSQASQRADDKTAEMRARAAALDNGAQPGSSDGASAEAASAATVDDPAGEPE